MDNGFTWVDDNGVQLSVPMNSLIGFILPVINFFLQLWLFKVIICMQIETYMFTRMSLTMGVNGTQMPLGLTYMCTSMLLTVKEKVGDEHF